MKVFVKDEKCIGCGSCVSLTDEKVFDFNDDGKAFVKDDDILKEDEEAVKNAINYCPTGAIYEDGMDNN